MLKIYKKKTNEDNTDYPQVFPAEVEEILLTEEQKLELNLRRHKRKINNNDALLWPQGLVYFWLDDSHCEFFLP